MLFNAGVIFTCIICVMLCWAFLKPCWKYYCFNTEILECSYYAERDNREMTEAEKQNETILTIQRDIYISESDVAKWCFRNGDTLTGKIIRFNVIILITILTFCAIGLALVALNELTVGIQLILIKKEKNKVSVKRSRINET